MPGADATAPAAAGAVDKVSGAAELEAYVKEREGRRVIRRVLIANNGIAAVKAITSIRRWCYTTFGDERVIQFVVMATPEDMSANAMHVGLGDELVPVPGGASHCNYRNVELILEIAQASQVDAVNVGWGHASEDPALPRALVKLGIAFIGPGANAMAALGDKISATLIAQSARVSVLPWSGDQISAEYTDDGVDPDLYEASCVHDAREALECAQRIKFPVMIKASEGGGGKGIRKVTEASEVVSAFRQVQGEVPGSPIFIMKLAPKCRHLEVQVLADEHGNAISLYGRDCSVQRRHQKILEEGPVTVASAEVWREMEQQAVRMARKVSYVGAGTVEYLYIEETGGHYFLELNPRLQVEHPVTEMISGVNLPAAQLQVAMGIALDRIPDIRAMYNRDPHGVDRIDFLTSEQRAPLGHCIAARITAENPDLGFQPTSGSIQELEFRAVPHVWGYFSVSGDSSLHEFADSQFGHLFAWSDTREAARKNLVIALKEVSIRGDIQTPVEYLRKLLETRDFRTNHIGTSWLDGLIAGSVQADRPDSMLAVLCGAANVAFSQLKAQTTEFVDRLERGQTPSFDVLKTVIPLELILENVKYQVRVHLTGPSTYMLVMNDTCVDVEVQPMADAGLLVLVDGKSHTTYAKEHAGSLRLSIDGRTCTFSKERDPSKLVATTTGKLVRYIVEQNAHVDAGQPYAEVEVMKMFLPLVVEESGILTHRKPEGSVLVEGDVIAVLKLDDPSRVRKASLCEDHLRALKPPRTTGNKPHHVLSQLIERVMHVLDGYAISPVPPRGTADDSAAINSPSGDTPSSEAAALVTTTTAAATTAGPSASAASLLEEKPLIAGPGDVLAPEPLAHDDVVVSKLIAALIAHLFHPDVPRLRIKALLATHGSRWPRSLVVSLKQLIEAMQDPVFMAQDRTAAIYAADAASGSHAVHGDMTPLSASISPRGTSPMSSPVRAGGMSRDPSGLGVSPMAMPLSFGSNSSSAGSNSAGGAPGVTGAAMSMLASSSEPGAAGNAAGTGALPSEVMTIGNHVRRIIDETSAGMLEPQARREFMSAVSPLAELATEYAQGVRGAAIAALSNLLQTYLDVESVFELGKNPETIIRELRLKHKDNLIRVVTQCRALSGKERREKLVLAVMSAIETSAVLSIEDFAPQLHDLAMLQHRRHAPIALKAKEMLMMYQLPDFRQRRLFIEGKLIRASRARDQTEREGLLHSLVGTSTAIIDVLCTLMVSAQPQVRAMALEAYVRRVYLAFELRDLQINLDQGTVSWYFLLRRDAPIRLSSASASDSFDDLSIFTMSRRTFRYGKLHLFQSLDVFQSQVDSVIAAFEPENKVAARDSLAGGSGPNTPTIPTAPRLPGYPSSSGSRRASVSARGSTGSKSSDRSAGNGVRPMHTLKVMCMLPSDFDEDEWTESMAEFLGARAEALRAKMIRRVTFMLIRMSGDFPFYYTFREDLRYREAKIHRHVEPPQAHQLELKRLAAYHIELVPSQNRHVHVYYGVLKDAQLAKGHPERMIFVRFAPRYKNLFVVDTTQEYHASAAERSLLESLDTLELVLGNEKVKPTVMNHLFLNYETEVIGMDVKEVEAIIVGLIEKYGERLWKLRVLEAEVRINLKISNTAENSPVRFVISNPSRYAIRMDCYLEVHDASTGRAVYSSLTPAKKGPLEGQPVDVPYSTLDDLQGKRSMALRNETTYVYDWPALFERQMHHIWERFSANRSVSTGRMIPERVLIVTEYVLDSVSRSLVPLPQPRPAGNNTVGMVVWRFRCFTPEHRNGRDVIVIANDITFQSGSFGPDEDAMFMAASELARAEGIPRLYLAANSGARIGLAQEVMERFRVAWRDPANPAKGVSYLYLSDEDYQMLRQRNSVIAERLEVELDDDMVDELTIESVDEATASSPTVTPSESPVPPLSDSLRQRSAATPINRTNSLDSLADDEPQDAGSEGDDTHAPPSPAPDAPAPAARKPAINEAAAAAAESSSAAAAASAKRHQVEVRWVLTDVIGQKHGLGVENLKGSGLIAGETSQAYEDIFTLSFVTGRTVGIGAYLVRLGQRTIQSLSPPILLTGAGALNKVLGRQVYSSNQQLGGWQIMYPNGVTHLTVHNDMKGVDAILRWLSYVPTSSVSPLPSVMPFDPVDRLVTASPSKSQHDPRHWLRGYTDVERGGQWVSGFFDRDSFFETLGGWARTVVVGRARLGGIPVGCIAVETRTQDHVKPADPANPRSHEQITQQAGQVWYPDSAFKTAQAIRDFNRGERLPLFVFANWRGFSGGMRDMFDEILKFGSYIVDALREYTQPVFVYLPPHAELRGGAWVVLDPSINPDMMEMYADPRSRGGVLEPSGTVEIKYRRRELLKTMERLDPEFRELCRQRVRIERRIATLESSLGPRRGSSSAVNTPRTTLSKAAEASRLDLAAEKTKLMSVTAKLKEREEALASVYQQVAVAFADLHDTPGRMKAKEVIREIVSWESSREFFYWRLRRRLAIEKLRREISTAMPSVTRDETTALMHAWCSKHVEANDVFDWENDFQVLRWLRDDEAGIQAQLRALRERNVEHQMMEMFRQDPEMVTRFMVQVVEASQADKAAATASAAAPTAATQAAGKADSPAPAAPAAPGVGTRLRAFLRSRTASKTSLGSIISTPGPGSESSQSQLSPPPPVAVADPPSAGDAS